MVLLQQSISEKFNQSPIAVFNPAQQAAINNILQTLVKQFEMTNILLTESIIGQYDAYAQLCVHTDLRPLLGKNITIQFQINDQTARDLSALDGSKDTLYFEIDDCYMITNGHYSITLPKITPQHPAIACPVMESDFIGQPITDINLKALRAYLGKQTGTQLILYDDQLERIQQGNKNLYTFNAAAAFELHDESPSHVLYSQYFLAGVGKNELRLQMAKNSDGHWLVTQWRTAHKIAYTTYELLMAC
jgi:hypothetical protein